VRLTTRRLTGGITILLTLPIGMLRAGTATIAEVAELYGQTRQAISARCKRHGINVEANRKAWLRKQWLAAVEREAVEQERRLAAFDKHFDGERPHHPGRFQPAHGADQGWSARTLWMGGRVLSAVQVRVGCPVPEEALPARYRGWVAFAQPTIGRHKETVSGGAFLFCNTSGSRQ
jgi:hypothetical protein